MSQTAIPCMLMRGGSSKGPYLNMADLPADIQERDRILLGIMGSPDPRQIDGLGGAEFLTSKLAMVGVSERSGVDVDYLFAQVDIENPVVDTGPPCGNMLAGVGPYAIETGLVPTMDPVTRVMIFNVNTNTLIEALIQTPGGQVSYEGDVEIDGVPGSAAPVVLNFSNVAGGKTGALLPTGNVRDTIEGIEVSCIDASMPMVIIHADSLGLAGDEDAEFFRTSKDLMMQIESIRLIAGQLMGLGDVSNTVIPKVGIISAAEKGGTIRSRYLTPHSLHAAHAVTGAICVATAACMPGSVASEITNLSGQDQQHIVIEHISGKIEVMLETDASGGQWTVKKAGVVRTTRKIMSGVVYV